MGKVIMSGIVPPLVAPVSYKANFADNTWEQIIDACQKNAVPDTWLVGDQKAMTINGTDYAIDIIGRNHDDYADGSGKAPLTFQMHDCHSTAWSMNSTNTNGGGWGSCDLRKTRLPQLLDMMPYYVQAGIKEVNKLTSMGRSNSTILTTADKLFLLSEIEIFGSNTYSVAGEGVQYDYYKAGNSTVKNKIGNANNWWERSPRKNYDTQFCCVGNNGNVNAFTPSSLLGVSFAFCF